MRQRRFQHLLLVHGTEIDFGVALQVTDDLLDVLLADLSIYWLFPRKRTQDRAQPISIGHRTVVRLQLESEADVQVQIGLLARGHRRLVLVLAKLTHPPLAQDEVTLIQRVTLELHRYVHRRRRLAIALQVVDLVRHVALLGVLLQQGQWRLHRALGRLLLDQE